MKMNQATHWSFTPSELKTLLFRKKVCPICGNKLEKRKTYETHTTHWFGVNHPRCVRDAIAVKENKIFYACPNCGRKFSLEELGKYKYKEKD